MTRQTYNKKNSDDKNKKNSCRLSSRGCTAEDISAREYRLQK